MNLGGHRGCELATALAAGCRELRGVEVVVAPPFTALAAVAATLAEVGAHHVGVAGQNLFPKDSGAFTGEISAPMLLEAGCAWVILGHSERRQFFGETDASVEEKTRAAMKAGLRPIVCVGESLAERDAGRTMEVILGQLRAFAAALAEAPGYGVVAYEPVWAIGTGRVAGPEQAEEAHAALRAELAALSAPLAAATRILYGGSVKADNAASLLACPNVDGALVGGASLDAPGFLAIVRAAVATRS